MFLLTFYLGYCEVQVLHVEFPSSNFACVGAVDVRKILMVCFRMEFNMFEYVFQDLTAVEDVVAFFFSNALSKLGSDECCTYAHNHLYHIVNYFEQVAADSKVRSIGLKSYRRVLFHDSQL